MARLGRYRRIEIQVGIFALLGIVVLVLGLFWLRDVRFRGRYSVYKATFVDTGGLMPGDMVTVSGFRKGVVRDMRLLENGVEVELAVENDVLLHRDARAVIATRGLLGERFVQLERGAAEGRLAPGSMLQGELQVGMADLMAGTGDLVASARAASEDVRKIVAALAGATEDHELENGLRDASQAAKELRALLQENRDSFNASVQSFRQASESLARMTGRSEGDVVALVADLRAAAAEIDSLIDQLQVAAGKTDRAASQMLNEDSTFGQLVHDRQLYDRLVRVATGADSLIADLRAHPKRFFKLSIF